MKIEDQLKEIREIVYKSRETTERLEANWDKDRKDFSEFQNRLGHLEQEVKSVKEVLNRIPEKTKEKVEEAVKPVTNETKDLKEVIVDKKMIAISTDKVKNQLKRWWQFWR